MANNTVAKIYLRALQLMGQFMRNNPPGNLDKYYQYPGLAQALYCGKSDPEGKEYVKCFVNLALKEHFTIDK